PSQRGRSAATPRGHHGTVVRPKWSHDRHSKRPGRSSILEKLDMILVLPVILVCSAPRDAGTVGSPSEATLVEVRKIWDRAAHNAFTDLVRFQGRWSCVFREGASHVSPDGAIRVLTSVDGVEWTSAALITSPTADLRDPKLSVTPDGRLMLLAGGA